MGTVRRLLGVMTVVWLTGTAAAGPEWVVHPGEPEPDLPPTGRSLFDHLVGSDPVPFPLETFLARIEARLEPDAYLARPLKRVLIPLGRSLQREAGAPAFFRFPRAVAAVDGEAAAVPGDAGPLLRDRLYIGYLEKADVLEVISYNESAARFEFQVVRDYREGGGRRVSYAPRALCTACHQNAAPIFARPLWDETNANPRVAELLAAEGRGFYGFPLAQGTDLAYAIDNATDRANGFSLTQRLWREGCGAGTQGRRCRGDLVIAALRFALSGRHPSAHEPALVEAMRTARAGHWPEGLLLPDPDIPNRRPLERVARLDEPAPAIPDAAALFGESSIPAQFEPLAPRSPAATWNPPDREWVERAVQGLAEFLARSDARRLDAHLNGQPVPVRRLAADCQIEARSLGDGRQRLKLACAGDGLSLQGRIFRDGDGRLSGRATELRLDDADLGALVLAGQAEDDRLELTASRAHNPVRPRLPNGNALDALAIARNGEGGAMGRLTALVREDFPLVTAAVDALVAQGHEAFGGIPFQRARVLPSLLGRLGMEPLTWCCLDDGHLPPPVMERPQVGDELPGLNPFYQVCARCHGNTEPFPPNFLAGSPDEVGRRVGHCAERIAFRLAMWDIAIAERPKTPMPPQQILPAIGTTVETWPGDPRLAALRQALRDLGQRGGEPLPPLEDLLARDYATLRPCLPDTQLARGEGAHP